MPTSPTWKRVAVALAVLFAVLNTANAINKGGDADVFFEGGRRLLAGEPLYEGSSAAAGFIGPPFQALFFAPFAAVASASPLTAKLVWHIVNVACLFGGVWMMVATWRESRRELGLRAHSRLPAFLAALGAVLLPLQTNFEHQNMNAPLLALLAAATWQLTLGSALVAGVLIGAATALKAFPLLLIVYLGARRQWRAFVSAIVTATVLTMVPVFVYGPGRFAEELTTFWRLGNSGWPVRGNNQSLVAATDRYVSGFTADGVRVASDNPLTALVYTAIAGGLILLMVRALVTTRPARPLIPCEITAATVLAILLSPIAWDHYWTLIFPAFLIVYDSGAADLLGRGGRYAFWIAAVLTTGLSPLTLGRSGFGMARAFSASTIAAVIVYCALLLIWERLSRRERSP